MKKLLVKSISIFLLLITYTNGFSQIKLSHNVGDNLLVVDNVSCSTSEQWARSFKLSDFGIPSDKEFLINSGQVGLSYSTSGGYLEFRIYKDDGNFPISFNESNLIGKSQEEYLTPISYKTPTLININFNTPIIIPLATERIIVVVSKIARGSSSPVAHIAGTKQETGISWERSCTNNYKFTNTDTIDKDMNCYIVVNGIIQKPAPYKIEYNDKDCLDFNIDFDISNNSDIKTILWNFGDPSSSKNSSKLITPSHLFSTYGDFNVEVEITNLANETYHLKTVVNVPDPPKANSISNIYLCEDIPGSGKSKFDSSSWTNTLLNGQRNRVVTFYDNNKNLINPLPSFYENKTPNREIITARVSLKNDLSCYDETTFELNVNPLPILSTIPAIEVCDDNNDGFYTYSTVSLEQGIISGNTNLEVELYDSGYSLLKKVNESSFTNTQKNGQKIIIRLTNKVTKCFSETTFNYTVNPQPIAHSLDKIISCDDDMDGISKTFDLTQVIKNVIKDQTNTEVTFYDDTNQIINIDTKIPYTNIKPYIEILTLRVTNKLSKCYDETKLELHTSNKPLIIKPNNIYSCNLGDNFGEFDTSMLQQDIIGNQTGLKITYTDSNNNLLPSPLPNPFITREARMSINVKVEDIINSNCFSETSLELIMNNEINLSLKPSYSICDLDKAISVKVDSSFDNYLWEFEDGTKISTTNTVELAEEGNYFLIVEKLQNGIICSKRFSTVLNKSKPPKIIEIKKTNFSNNSSSIEIIHEGTGNYEFSKDGVNFSSSSYFENLKGGIYDIYIRDTKGCGHDKQSISLLNYPSFLTPNEDGINDTWQINGLEVYNRINIMIFDRYGKLLKRINNSSETWDGKYNGKPLPEDEYWIIINLDNKSFKDHIVLKR